MQAEGSSSLPKQEPQDPLKMLMDVDEEELEYEPDTINQQVRFRFGTWTSNLNRMSSSKSKKPSRAMILKWRKVCRLVLSNFPCRLRSDIQLRRSGSW